MFKFFKRLLCSHAYVVNEVEAFYKSVGDEFSGRKSYKYHLHCIRCNDNTVVIKTWKFMDKEVINRDGRK